MKGGRLVGYPEIMGYIHIIFHVYKRQNYDATSQQGI